MQSIAWASKKTFVLFFFVTVRKRKNIKNLIGSIVGCHWTHRYCLVGLSSGKKQVNVRASSSLTENKSLYCSIISLAMTCWLVVTCPPPSPLEKEYPSTEWVYCKCRSESHSESVCPPSLHQKLTREREFDEECYTVQKINTNESEV